MKTSTKSIGAAALALGTGTLIALAPAVAASAHVSASATSTAAGSYTVVTFSVPHGCDGSPTLVVSIDLPESVASVTPTVNANWTVEKVVNELTELVTSVVYTTTDAGLPDGYRDAFELSLQLPDGEAGDVVAFPVVQTCAEGTAEWIGDDAPAITLTAATEGDAHGDDAPASHPEAAPASQDVLARVFGVAGLAIGAAGVVIAVLSRRGAKA